MKKNLMWFRHDLRVSDNPALTHAAENIVVPIYIVDKKDGAATRLWLDCALQDLNISLNGCLKIYVGDPEEIMSNLCKENQIHEIYANIVHTPYYTQLDACIAKIKPFHRYHASLLWNPAELYNGEGSPYRVYSPFKKACFAKQESRAVLNSCWGNFTSSALTSNYSFPKASWHEKMLKYWNISETGAHAVMLKFLASGLNGYKKMRNYPSAPNVSRLSPYLRHGQISPHQIMKYMSNVADSEDKEAFVNEILWREFSYYLLHHFPDLPYANFNKSFDNFAWGFDKVKFELWKKGKTGYPLVDAAMRELWETGYMHNRSRMVVASFLVKNLNIHWKYGAEWFWDCLFDADLANNSASWQWVAGSGADAAPYFRIFNPVLQGEKHDKDGVYVKKFVPELLMASSQNLFNPDSRFPKYPIPIVNCKTTRDATLTEYMRIKGKNLE